eukprot:s1114_g20.t1
MHTRLGRVAIVNTLDGATSEVEILPAATRRSDDCLHGIEESRVTPRRFSLPSQRGVSRSFPPTLMADAQAGQSSQELILRMSQQGIAVEVISEVLQIEGDSVVQILQQSGNAQDSSCSTLANHEQRFMSEVKELLTDPVELCCPISLQLMEDPVIAEDGYTYERSCIQRSLEVKRESPMTNQPIQSLALIPNRDKKSAVVVYREAVVKKGISIKHNLLSSTSIDEALKLLDKAELFVRPLLPDTSARRKLVALLMIRVKLLGSSRDAIILEITVLLFEIEGSNQVRCFLNDIQEHEVLCLLEKLEDDMVTRLRDTNVNLYKHKDAIDLELARRLARRAMRVGNDAPLEELWMLMRQHDHKDSWARAAAVLLASCMPWLDVNLQMLGDKLLDHAHICLDSRDLAVSTAKDFFKHDLRIPAAPDWPPKECASIVMELAIRTSDDNLRRIRLLAEAYKMNPANGHLRAEVLKHLHQRRFSAGWEGAATVMYERLFLKLVCADKQEIPEDLLPRLTLSNDQLQELSAEELLFLGEQIGLNRQTDGSRLIVKAAELFATVGAEERSQDAFLRAFSLDPHNAEAADGLIQTVMTMKQKGCQGGPLMSFKWDLSGYDFTSFRKGDKQTSNLLPLSQWGIKAWLTLYPVGEKESLAGKASLHIDWETGAGNDDCCVRGNASSAKQTQTPFLFGPGKWIRRNFMDTSEILLQPGRQKISTSSGGGATSCQTPRPKVKATNGNMDLKLELAGLRRARAASSGFSARRKPQRWQV